MPESIANVDVSEIEITPEMIEAGAEALRGFDGGYMEPHEDAAERIYRAMWHVREAGLAPDRQVREDTL